MGTIRRILVVLMLSGLLSGVAFAEDQVPRTIIAFYGGGAIENSYIHKLAEMPLNQLGLMVEYHDIHQPLPDIAHRKDVRGVLTWFLSDAQPETNAYLEWANAVVEAGKKFVILGAPGIFGTPMHPPNSELARRFLNHMGLELSNRWIDRPFDVAYDYLTPDMFLSTSTYQWTRPLYEIARATGQDSVVHLKAKSTTNPSDSSDLIITGPNGGYVASGYIFRENMNSGDEVAQWLINPFAFFQLAYDTDAVPKPDTTTLAGRRIYYSHIDGDGWNNITQLPEYKGKNILSAQVVLDKVIEPNPDMPVMVAVIAADIDPAWDGVKDSREIAQKILALPQVEAGTHTYSHPFYWRFFEGHDPNVEIPYLHLYTEPTWQPADKSLLASTPTTPLPNGYIVPRAYAHEPFDLHKEIAGSVAEISKLLPADKKVEILAWPGDCSPWEDVIRLTREQKIQNINGGDSRFDQENPAYGSEAAIGRQIGKERLIYSTSSNEDIYTDLWTDNFNAFEYLKKTLRNTETPLRVKPLSIYYHIYSGEREASLKALLGNINYARQQNIVPITASDYTRIAEGFYSTVLTQVTPNTWRVDNRGALETIRFDHSSLQSVDFMRSIGVVGERYLQGSLYVYLDAAVKQPVIALKNNEAFLPSDESIPYLVESRWIVSDVHRGNSGLDFTAHGYGNGEMVWKMPAHGSYGIVINGQKKIVNAPDGVLNLNLQGDAMHTLHVSIHGA